MVQIDIKALVLRRPITLLCWVHYCEIFADFEKRILWTDTTDLVIKPVIVGADMSCRDVLTETHVHNREDF